MATLRQLKAEAAKHGAVLNINRDYGEAEAYFPDDLNLIWDASQAGCIIVSYGYTGKGVMAMIYSDLIELMKGGSTAGDL